VEEREGSTEEDWFESMVVVEGWQEVRTEQRLRREKNLGTLIFRLVLRGGGGRSRVRRLGGVSAVGGRRCEKEAFCPLSSVGWSDDSGDVGDDTGHKGHVVGDNDDDGGTEEERERWGW